jgi:hypothetical protein
MTSLTSEERTDAHLDAMSRGDECDAQCTQDHYDALLHYFDSHDDPNERALGEMIRNGVERVNAIERYAKVDEPPLYVIGPNPS